MKRKPEAQSIYLILGCSFVPGIVWSIFSFRSSELLIMGSIFVAGLLLGIICGGFIMPKISEEKRILRYLN